MRPPISPKEKTVTRTITVTKSQAAFLKKYGLGNTSLGVRRLVDENNDSALPKRDHLNW